MVIVYLNDGTHIEIDTDPNNASIRNDFDLLHIVNPIENKTYMFRWSNVEFVECEE